MVKKGNFTYFIQKNKIILTIIIIALFLIELEIFTIAVMKSGHKSMLQVYNDQGNIIYETNGQDLSDFNKHYFEKLFGPFEQYQVKLISQDIPFPFRAWFVAAAGIPIGIILLFAFIIKAYLAIFYHKSDETSQLDAAQTEYQTRFEKILSMFNRLNIFTIGFLVFIAILAYWVIPNFLVYMGKVGIETLIDYKWVFIVIAISLAGFFIWIVYLKYLLAKKSIESQTELEKYRIQLDYDKISSQKLLPANNNLEILEPPCKNKLNYADRQRI